MSVYIIKNQVVFNLLGFTCCLSHACMYQLEFSSLCLGGQYTLLTLIAPFFSHNLCPHQIQGKHQSFDKVTLHTPCVLLLLGNTISKLNTSFLTFMLFTQPMPPTRYRGVNTHYPIDKPAHGKAHQPHPPCVLYYYQVIQNQNDTSVLSFIAFI